jgi:hypothetical protein
MAAAHSRRMEARYKTMNDGKFNFAFAVDRKSTTFLLDHVSGSAKPTE